MLRSRLSPALAHFEGQVGAGHAIQAVLGLPAERADALTRRDQVVVPARDLLSQLP